MTEHLIDRMPDVAHGRSSWTAAEAAHLSSCGDCRDEWRIVARVARADVSKLRTPLDIEALQAGVIGRLREEGGMRSLPARPAVPRIRWWPVAAAAALAAAIGGPVLFDRLADEAAPAVAVVPVRGPTLLPELDRLFEDELEILLAMMEPPVDELSPGAAPRLGDLTDSELEMLLGEIEG